MENFPSDTYSLGPKSFSSLYSYPPVSSSLGTHVLRIFYSTLSVLGSVSALQCTFLPCAVSRGWIQCNLDPVSGEVCPVGVTIWDSRIQWNFREWGPGCVPGCTDCLCCSKALEGAECVQTVGTAFPPGLPPFATSGPCQYPAPYECELHGSLHITLCRNSY